MSASLWGTASPRATFCAKSSASNGKLTSPTRTTRALHGVITIPRPLLTRVCRVGRVGDVSAVAYAGLDVHTASMPKKLYLELFLRVAKALLEPGEAWETAEARRMVARWRDGSWTVGVAATATAGVATESAIVLCEALCVLTG